jgi:starch-binding outer membrane protein, SusD/RagB family
MHWQADMVVFLIIATQLEIGGDNSQLYVPRSTEQETWDFVLAQCDAAIMYLPEG